MACSVSVQDTDLSNGARLVFCCHVTEAGILLKRALDVFAGVLGMSQQRFVAVEMEMPQPIALDGFRGR